MRRLAFKQTKNIDRYDLSVRIDNRRHIFNGSHHVGVTGTLLLALHKNTGTQRPRRIVDADGHTFTSITLQKIGNAPGPQDRKHYQDKRRSFHVTPIASPPAWDKTTETIGEFGLDVQISHLQRIGLDELTPWFNHIAHQLGEHLVGRIHMANFDL